MFAEEFLPVYRWLVRERLLAWGADEAEVHARLPGDQLLEDADAVATRAITIDAPPSAVWPWIARQALRASGVGMRASLGSTRAGSTYPLSAARGRPRRCRPRPAVAPVHVVVKEDRRG
jgi:hypothetical protein